MIQSNHLRFLLFGLLILLTACSSAVSGSAQISAEVEEPSAVEVEQEVASGKGVVTGEEELKQEELVSAVDAQPEEEATPLEQVSSAQEAIMPEDVVSDQEAVRSEDAAGEEEMVAEGINAAGQGPTETQQRLLDSLAVKGTPPELFNEVWLNSEPLKLADLRGQVVIVEFWTFG